METEMELFDWEYYISAYIDLKKAGIDNSRKAWRHWVKYGRSEGRVCIKQPENIELQLVVKEKPIAQPDAQPDAQPIAQPDAQQPHEEIIFPKLVVKVPPKVLEINTKKPAAKRTPAAKKKTT